MLDLGPNRALPDALIYLTFSFRVQKTKSWGVESPKCFFNGKWEKTANQPQRRLCWKLQLHHCDWVKKKLFLKQKLLIWLLVKPLQQLWWLLTLSFQWGKHDISLIVIIMNNTGGFQNVRPGWGADVKLAVPCTGPKSRDWAGAEQFAGHDKCREHTDCQSTAQFNFNTTWCWCWLAAVTG